MHDAYVARGSGSVAGHKTRVRVAAVSRERRRAVGVRLAERDVAEPAHEHRRAPVDGQMVEHLLDEAAELPTLVLAEGLDEPGDDPLALLEEPQRLPLPRRGQPDADAPCVAARRAGGETRSLEAVDQADGGRVGDAELPADVLDSLRD